MTTGREMRKYIPEKMDFQGTMRFQHVELGREGFVGGGCWKVLSMDEPI